MSFEVRNATINEGSPFKAMARVNGDDNTPITQATLSGGSIAWKLFDLTSSTPETAVQSGTLTIADVIYDTLQTTSDDAAWTEDSTASPGPDGRNGYNFAEVFAPSNFVRATSGPGHFRLEIRGTPSSGNAFWIGIWEVEVRDTLTDLSGE